ncbi:hypothetical protein K2173_007378 [Erythroxylum novogranatense]|uniref:Uncharacterized protein n=1 Tax=Erythroxylum novogranatense TaxID=1862640 RepID=A0AAV8T612_9ROSI|nr:hypothetical protein K2173_007378 [Erythroxylum novogranatense]
MDPVASAVEKFKRFAKSSQEFINGLVHHRNPIEILKRLQREAFSDLMKLRDRQDKVERMLSFYKISKGSPFQETSTHVRGEVDVMGTILMVGDTDQEHFDALDRAGLRAGILSRLTFETNIREKDTLIAEFVSSQKGSGYSDDFSGNTLSLEKLLYLGSITDWLSAIAVPVGAQFWDFGIATNSSKQRKRLCNYASAGPPLLNEHNGSAVGVSVRKSNIMASMAHSVSVPRMQPRDITHGNCFNSFGQIILQLPVGLKLSLSGLHQVRKSRNPHLNFGALIFPVDFLQHFKASDTSGGPSVPTLGINTHERVSTGSISLKLEKNFDEYTGIDGWIEMKNCNYRQVQWAVNVFDESEDEFGWGLSLSGMTETPNRLSRIQAETYLKLNISKKFNLKPGVTYAIDGNAILFGLTLQSHWTF